MINKTKIIIKMINFKKIQNKKMKIKMKMNKMR